MSGANSIYLPEAKAEQIKDGIGDGALKNTKSLGDIPAIEIRTTGPRNQQIVGEDPIVDSESVHSEPHSEPVLANHDVNLVSSLQRRGGTTVSDDDVQSISKGWRHLRNAVKVTTAVSMKKRTVVTREDSFLKKFSTRQPYRADSEANLNDKYDVDQKPEDIPKVPLIFRVDGNLMWYWLGVVTVAVLYNLWTCIAREAFREIQEDYHIMWLIMDAFCDFIYVLDIVCQFRTGYLDQGILVYDAKKLAKKYISSRSFILDLLSLLPLDLIQIGIGMHPMLRFPRFIKVYRSFRFIYMMESRTAFPNFFRVANLTHILFLGSHWFAAFYYLISEAENFEGSWSYPKPVGEFSSVTRKYLASLFWSTLTLTTIGDLPPPETNWEYVFVIVSYLIGVFIFATIVGQVGNVITNRNASRQEFERLLDGAKMYMRTHNVPPELQKRVQRWYDYVWKRGRMKGSDINSLGMLPDKFKTELAIHVNLETLKKVTIFQECQPEFLHDLVLKMRAYIFTPGDLICRRGEIAREMFIIADGRVEIISESGTVLTQMGTGDFFGEIGILNLDGGINRRTADVKSVGYSELFGLSREDVLEALKDHPDAELIIRNYGQKRLKEIEKHRKINKAPPSVWSPNSPCKGLRSMIATANRGSANRGPLPGLNLSEAEGDVGERPCKNRRTSFLNNVRKFIGESRFNRGKYDRSLRSNRSVHPTHSTNIFSMANTFPMRGSTKRNGIKINSLSANHSPPPTSESVEAPLLDIKCTTRESSGKNDDTLLTPGSVLPKSTVTFRGHSNSFSSIRSKDFNNFLYPTRKAQSCVEPIPSPQHLSIHPTEPCFSGQRAYPDIEANVNDNNEEDGYIPPYKDYSKVVQGVAKLPRKFRLPDKYHSPEDDITPLPSPLNSRSASPMVSRRSDEHSFQCCCTKLTSDMKSLEQRMTSMEQAYKESLQRLGAISSQQTVLVASMQQILQIQGIHPQGKKQETKDEPFNKQTKL